MRFVGYLRVSSAGQVDAWGLDRQERAIKSWARTNGHRIVGWCRDEGVSGTIEAISRPGFLDAVSKIGHGADGVLIADLDRLARALHVQEAALAVVWKAGGGVYTATGGEVQQNDPDDPARTFVRKVMGLVIEYEKDQAVKRMRQGRQAKAVTGKHAVGQYAFGYRGEGKGRERDAAPYPEEQQAVDFIVARRKAGASFRVIAASLDAAGLKPRRAEAWSAMAVRSVWLRHRSTRGQH
jgi:DNA invertase Pin-like site-specific DNA recombinase